MTEANESLRRVKPVLFIQRRDAERERTFFGAVVLSAGRRSLQRLSWYVQRHDIVPSRTAGNEAKRIEILPDVPTIGEFVPGYEASGWEGIGAPANTRPQIIAILNKLVNETLASAEFKARFVDLGLEPYATSPAEFGKFIVDYTEKWGKVIRDAIIKPD
jgi:hypothetical protein